MMTHAQVRRMMDNIPEGYALSQAEIDAYVEHFQTGCPICREDCNKGEVDDDRDLPMLRE